MISLVDATGAEVPIAPYQDRVRASQAFQMDTLQYVADRERELNALEPNVYPNGEGRGYADSKEFGNRMKRFLVAATYAENVAETYSPSEKTQQQMFDYWDSSLSFNSSFDEKTNSSMYDLEKMVRLGLVPVLEAEGETLFKPRQREAIMRVEDELYHAGRGTYQALREGKHRDFFTPRKPGMLIKMLSRHKVLGLPDIKPERKKDLQEVVRIPGVIYNAQLGCSALRAGFEIPPVRAEFIDKEIRAWVEQEEEALEERLDQIFMGQVERMEELGANRDQLIMRHGLGARHHLYRWLGMST